MTGSTSRDAPRASRERAGGHPRALVAVLVLVLLLGIAAVRIAVMAPVRIASASMEPTLGAGDVVLASRSAPRVDELQRWDLVVFASPRTGSPTIKRVIGLPGEEVVVLDGVLHVDGKPRREPWVDPEHVDGYYSRTFRVPPGHVFVLGDNRGNSIDSRDYGALDEDELRGRVLVRLWTLPGSDR